MALIRAVELDNDNFPRDCLQLWTASLISTKLIDLGDT